MPGVLLTVYSPNSPANFVPFALDIHTHNICFANPLNSHQSDAEVIKSLGTPRRADVDAKYGFPLTPSIPSYIVEPTSFPNLMLTPGSCQIKLVDFGAAVSQSEKPRGTCCCMDFRAPEDVLKDQKDVRSDIWSLGCTVFVISFLGGFENCRSRLNKSPPPQIFELIVGYPLFDTWPQNSNADLIREWIPVLGDLPAEWNVEPPMITEISGKTSLIFRIPHLFSYIGFNTLALSLSLDPSEPTTLSALLQNGYFEQEIDEDTGERYETFYGRDETPYFSTADIRSIASLLRSMLHYRPEDRLSVEEVGSHPWLRRPPGLK
ncbi:MAG: hypothetical protein M1836_005244 [Candelina mexicana]|nr:MAG: hypothetical protein M1836_005244 [Candelina mexicana]